MGCEKPIVFEKATMDNHEGCHINGLARFRQQSDRIAQAAGHPMI
jgi:hypothetical protein